MLTEKEIMIGDWVMYNPNVFIEDEYEPAKEWFPTQINSGEDIDLAIEGCYAPIPITMQILEKNGFRKELDDDGVHFRYTLITDGISFSLKYVLSVFEWLGPLDFKYVHELQHVLRLCGIKKEIEL